MRLLLFYISFVISYVYYRKCKRKQKEPKKTQGSVQKCTELFETLP